MVENKEKLPSGWNTRVAGHIQAHRGSLATALMVVTGWNAYGHTAVRAKKRGEDCTLGEALQWGERGDPLYQWIMLSAILISSKGGDFISTRTHWPPSSHEILLQGMSFLQKPTSRMDGLPFKE